MKHNYAMMGEYERLFMKEFCRLYNFIPYYFTDSKSKEHYDGILSAITGSKILVEVKVRNENEYNEGVLMEKKKYDNLITIKEKLQCNQIYYISVFNNVVTIIEVDKINPVWFKKELPLSYFDWTQVTKEIAYITDYIRLEDDRLLSYIYNIKSKNK